MEQLKKDLLDVLIIEDSIKRRIGIVAILTEALKPLNIIPVIVGGFAVELWTMGKYATLDVDLIADGINYHSSVLYELGFENKGGVWRYPESDIVIEFPKAPLDGDYTRLQPLQFDKYQLYVLGIEDIILDRVSAAKHWKDQSSREWATYLMAAHYDRIDWEYCDSKVIEKQLADEFASIKEEAYSITLK